jgi:hypothetical protein
MAVGTRKTKNPVIWFQYGCWQVQFWMMFHKPYYPLWFRMWLLDRYPEERRSLTWRTIEMWKRANPKWQPTHLPLPWYIGDHAFGPFLGPWNRLQNLVRKGTGGRSHRCEFTDPESGALYGRNKGAFMDDYFDQLIANIDAAGGDDE